MNVDSTSFDVVTLLFSVVPKLLLLPGTCWSHACMVQGQVLTLSLLLPAVNSNYFTVDCRLIPTPYQLDRAAGYTHQLLTLVQFTSLYTILTNVPCRCHFNFC